MSIIFFSTKNLGEGYVVAPTKIRSFEGVQAAWGVCNEPEWVKQPRTIIEHSGRLNLNTAINFTIKMDNYLITPIKFMKDFQIYL